MSDRAEQKARSGLGTLTVMQDEPDPEVIGGSESDRGSDPGVIGGSESARGSDAEVIGDNTVIGESNALDLVDEALEALDQDDLELSGGTRGSAARPTLRRGLTQGKHHAPRSL